MPITPPPLLQYGLPGDVTAVAPDDQETLADAFASNPEWAVRGELTFADPGPAAAGRVIVEVFRDVCPRAADNFLALCAGDRGLGKASKKPLHYKVRARARERLPRPCACCSRAWLSCVLLRRHSACMHVPVVTSTRCHAYTRPTPAQACAMAVASRRTAGARVRCAVRPLRG